ncbi:MAG: hypothetical protein IM638_10715 [Bacteroidetes bacterium]|nr:hypothetical protein [Bacteroidota bacterium]
MQLLTALSILLFPTLLNAQHDWNRVKPVRLAAPQWSAPATTKPTGTGMLKQVSMQANQITDGYEWRVKNALPDYFWSIPNTFGSKSPALPTTYPAFYNMHTVTLAWHDKGIVYYVYSDSLLFVADSASGDVHCAYDLGAYMSSPATQPGEQRFTLQEIRFARLEDSVLYIAAFHNTYAKSSGNQNGYITAIHTGTHQVKWRSAALVNNASTFVLRNGYLICGYGFTAEPDFVYVLNASSGEAVACVPVKSGPETIFEKGNKLYVRTYNTDYVFEMKLPKKK